MQSGLLFAACLSWAAALLVLGTPAALAQAAGGTPAQTGAAQTGGSLQMPAHPASPSASASASAPPQAAPRTPVRKGGEVVAQATPVVKAHGDPHRQKPAKTEKTKTAEKAKPAAPKPEVAAPQPAPEAKPETAEKQPDAERPDGSTPKLPRFAALRSDDVNMRVGPGSRYRIEWVYKRRDLPMEIEREFDVWRWVQDPDGNKGWVHQATLMGRRSFIIQKSDATLRSEASDTGSAVATLKVGVIGRIRSCDATSDWCNVQAGGYRGYLKRVQFWGTLPGEAVGP